MADGTEETLCGWKPGCYQTPSEPHGETVQEKILLQHMQGTGRQTLALTLNATINGIISKPGEKGEQHLESVTELFKFSLVLIVGQLPA